MGKPVRPLRGVVPLPRPGPRELYQARRVVNAGIDLDDIVVEPKGDRGQHALHEAMVVTREVETIVQLCAVAAVDDDRPRPVDLREGVPDLLRLDERRLVFRIRR